MDNFVKIDTELFEKGLHRYSSISTTKEDLKTLQNNLAILMTIKYFKYGNIPYYAFSVEHLCEILGLSLLSHRTPSMVKKHLSRFLNSSFSGYQFETIQFPKGVNSLIGVKEISAFSGNRFGRIFFSEFEKIMRINYQNKPLLLWAFAFIASQIFKRSPDDAPSLFPEAYDITYEEIAEQCGVSEMTAVKLMSLLEGNQLLCVYHSNTATRFGDQFFKIPNIYARFGQEQELKYKLEQLDSKKEKRKRRKNSKDDAAKDNSKPNTNTNDEDTPWGDDKVWGTPQPA